MGIDRSLMLRVQEILQVQPDAMTMREAVTIALRERYTDYDSLLQAASAFGAASANGLRKRTYDLRDQPTLFDIPEVIAIRTVDGDLFIKREHATLGQVRQHHHELSQYLAVQAMRSHRYGDELTQLASLPDDMLWIEARTALGPGDETDDPN